MNLDLFLKMLFQKSSSGHMVFEQLLGFLNDDDFYLSVFYSSLSLSF